MDFPGSDSKSICLQWGRPGFNPWVGKIPWRRKWQPTPVLLPGKSHGRRSLVGYSLWGHKESDTTEWLGSTMAHHSAVETQIHTTSWVNLKHMLNERYQTQMVTYCMIPIYTKHPRYLPPQRQEADEGLPGALGKRRLLKSPLDFKEIQPVHPKGNQFWIFIKRTDAEAEAPIPWPPDAKSQLIGKDPDAGKDWGEEEKGVTEDEMVR